MQFACPPCAATPTDRCMFFSRLRWLPEFLCSFLPKVRSRLQLMVNAMHIAGRAKQRSNDSVAVRCNELGPVQ